MILSRTSRPTGFLLGSLLSVALLSGCGSPAPRGSTKPVIAKVGDSDITQSDFMNGYARHILDVGVQDSEEQRRNYLDGLINKRLLVEYARENGLIDENAEEAAIEKIVDKLLLDAYTARVIYADAKVTEADMRDMFVRMNTQVTARHLYAPTIEQARSLRNRLEAGESFKDLAQEVFADSELASNGGSIGTFGFDEMDPAFEDAAFELDIGEISQPVKTAQGYSIIRVDDRFTNPLITETEFNARRDRVEQFVRYRKRIEARRSHVQSLIAELDVAFHEPPLSQLAAQITEPGGLDEAERLELGPSDLVSFGSGDDRQTWTVSEFRERATRTSAEQRSAVTDRSSLTGFIEGLIARDQMIERARELQLDKSETFEKARALAVEDWAYEQFRTDFRQQIEVPEDSIVAYFDRFGDEFVLPEKVRVWEILLMSKREADSVRALTASRPFEDLAAEFSTRQGASMTGGELGYVSRDQLGLLADQVFSARENDILGPVEIAGRYAILKVGDRQSARAAQAGEVHDLIKDRLRPILERKRLVEIVEQRKVHTDVTIAWETLYSAPLPSNLND